MTPIKRMHAAVATILMVQAAVLSAMPNAWAAAQIVGDAGRGREITSEWCSGCHLLDGKSGADSAPSLRGISAKSTRSPDFLRSFMARPHKPMPPLHLSNQNIEDVVAYFAAIPRDSDAR